MKKLVIATLMIAGTMVAMDGGEQGQQQQLPVVTLSQIYAEQQQQQLSQPQEPSWWEQAFEIPVWRMIGQEARQLFNEMIEAVSSNRVIDGDADATPAPTTATTATTATTSSTNTPRITPMIGCVPPQMVHLLARNASRRAQLIADSAVVQEQTPAVASTTAQQEPEQQRVILTTDSPIASIAASSEVIEQPTTVDTTGLSVQQIALLQKFADEMRPKQEQK